MKAKITEAKVAERKPQKAKCFRPYLSAAKAKGTSAIVFATDETAVMGPIVSPEKPISFR